MSPDLNLTILLFASLAEQADQSQFELPHIEGETIAALRQRLAKHTPAIATGLRASRLARNEAFAVETDTLMPGDCVAIIPPVAGG